MFEKNYQMMVRHNQTIEKFTSSTSTGLSDVWEALLSVPGTPTGPEKQWNIRVPTPSGYNRDDSSSSSYGSSSKRNNHHSSSSSSSSSSSHLNSSSSSSSSSSSFLFSTKSSMNHTYDLNRAENDLLDTFGMDERGALRDWNEEYQQSKELPANTIQERLIRARTLHKNQQDFLDAAKAGASAIVSGSVLSINPMDPAEARVYVFNNIFFSLSVPGAGRDAAEDGREVLPEEMKVVEEEDVVVTRSKHDLHGTLAMNRADVPGLYTLATAVLDYMGQRVVAQSIIPGILQGEHNSKLVYGSIDGGTTIASDPIMHTLMKEAARQMFVGERMVTPLGNKSSGGGSEEKDGEKDGERDGERDRERDGEALGVERTMQTCAGTEPVLLCGPVDCKGMEGCDGRHYVLDLVHMMPKDVNWMTEEAVAKIGESEGTLSGGGMASGHRAPKGCRESLCLLRPELIRQYASWCVSKAKDQVIQTHRRKLTKEKGEKANNTGDAEAAAGKAEDDGKTEDGVAVGNGTTVGNGTAEGDEKENKEEVDLDSKEPTLSDLLTAAMSPPALNPNVFGKHVYSRSTDHHPSDTTADNSIDQKEDNVQQKDEEMAKNLADYLCQRVIPHFLHEIKISSIMLVDGTALVATMHQRGINVRYLGHVATHWLKSYNAGREQRKALLVAQQTVEIATAAAAAAKDAIEDSSQSATKSPATSPAAPPSPVMSAEDDVRRSYFLRLCEIEMIARVVRHRISTLLRENQSSVMVAPASIIAKYLSRMMTRRVGRCEYSDDNDSETTAGAKHSAKHSVTPASAHALKASSKLIPSSGAAMWDDIRQDVFAKFRYNLKVWPGEEYYTSIMLPPVRSAAAAFGGKKNDLLIDVDRIALLRRVCQLVGLSMRSRQYRFQDEEPIQTQDIHDMTPVTKDGFTKIQMKDIVELIEYGRACLNQNQLSEAHGALQESLVYLYQAVGVMHEYVAVACSLLAQVYHAGGSVQQAILFEQRALCLYERLKGFDSYQVIHSHNFLATLWCKQKNGEKKAAKHMIRHLYLQRMACGQYHSDLNNSLIKLGTIYQAVGRLDQAAKTYQYALQKSVPNTIDYATCLHLLAKAYHLSSKHKEALTNVREVSCTCCAQISGCLLLLFPLVSFVLFQNASTHARSSSSSSCCSTTTDICNFSFFFFLLFSFFFF